MTITPQILGLRVADQVAQRLGRGRHAHVEVDAARRRVLLPGVDDELDGVRADVGDLIDALLVSFDPVDPLDLHPDRAVRQAFGELRGVRRRAADGGRLGGGGLEQRAADDDGVQHERENDGPVSQHGRYFRDGGDGHNPPRPGRSPVAVEQRVGQGE
jgi:hypothetical protein